MCKDLREIFFQISHGDYFLTELVVLTNYRTLTMLTFRKKDLVKMLLFCNVYIVIMFKQNTCMDLEKTRNNIEEKGDKHRLLEFKHAKE